MCYNVCECGLERTCRGPEGRKASCAWAVAARERLEGQCRGAWAGPQPGRSEVTGQLASHVTIGAGCTRVPLSWVKEQTKGSWQSRSGAGDLQGHGPELCCHSGLAWPTSGQSRPDGIQERGRLQASEHPSQGAQGTYS